MINCFCPISYTVSVNELYVLRGVAVGYSGSAPQLCWGSIQVLSAVQDLEPVSEGMFVEIEQYFVEKLFLLNQSRLNHSASHGPQ